MVITGTPNFATPASRSSRAEERTGAGQRRSLQPGQRRLPHGQGAQQLRQRRAPIRGCGYEVIYFLGQPSFFAQCVGSIGNGTPGVSAKPIYTGPGPSFGISSVITLACKATATSTRASTCTRRRAGPACAEARRRRDHRSRTTSRSASGAACSSWSRPSTLVPRARSRRESFIAALADAAGTPAACCTPCALHRPTASAAPAAYANAAAGCVSASPAPRPAASTASEGRPRRVWRSSFPPSPALIQGSVYGLLGLGLVLLYKSSRIFNFAQAEFGACRRVHCGLLRRRHRARARHARARWRCSSASLAGGAASALLTERLVIRPLFNAPKVTVVVATAGVFLLLYAVEGFLTGPDRAQLPRRSSTVTSYEGARLRITNQRRCSSSSCWPCWPSRRAVLQPHADRHGDPRRVARSRRRPGWSASASSASPRSPGASPACSARSPASCSPATRRLAPGLPDRPRARSRRSPRRSSAA